MAALFTAVMLMGILSLGISIAKRNRKSIEQFINQIFNDYE
jgi:hypothetical protein